MKEIDDYYKSLDKMESDIETFYARHFEMHECWKYSKEELQSFIVAWRMTRGDADWKHCHELACIIVNHEPPSKRGLIIPFVNRGQIDSIDMHHITIEGTLSISQRIQTVLIESGMDEEVAARLASRATMRMVGKQ